MFCAQPGKVCLKGLCQGCGHVQCTRIGLMPEKSNIFMQYFI